MVDQELAQSVLGAIEGPWVAVMVYGSRVRGDFTEESDIDVLQLVEQEGTDYARGRMTVAVRTVWQLGRQCRDGDFYALGLVREGVILADPSGVLADTLAQFRPVTDNYARKWREFRQRVGLLDAAGPEAFAANRVSFVRAMLYLLRNAAMIACLRVRGTPVFSLSEMADVLSLPGLPAVFAGRTDVDSLDRARMDRARAMFDEVYRAADLLGVGG